MLLVRDLMSQDVLCVAESDCLSRVYDLMFNKHIRHLPVIDEEGQICGLMTHRDLVKAALYVQGEVTAEMERATLVGCKVYSAMSHDVETVEPDTPLVEAGQIIIENKYGCLPVVEGGRVVGILTESDFVRYLVSSGRVVGESGNSGSSATEIGTGKGARRPVATLWSVLGAASRSAVIGPVAAPRGRQGQSIL